MGSPRLQRYWAELRSVGQAWSRYECTSLSASVAFYGALSLVPLLITLIAGLGAFLGSVEAGQNAEERVLAAFSEQYSPQMAASLERIIEGVQVGALSKGPIAAIGFIFASSLAFAQIDRGFARIWEVNERRKPGAFHAAVQVVLLRLRSLAFVAAWGFLVVVVFVAGFLLRSIREFGQEVLPNLPWSIHIDSLLIGFVVNFLVFTLLYISLSKQNVGLLLPVRSALFAALLWEVGSQIVASVIIGDKYSTYGLAGSFVAVLLWIYYNAMVLFLGALFVRVRFQMNSEPATTKRRPR